MRSSSWTTCPPATPCPKAASSLGTSHAILSARDVIDGPFAVINADDYYGPEAFQKIYDYLLANRTGTANMNTPWSAICWRTR